MLVIWKSATVESVTADLAVVHRPVQQGASVFGSGFGEHIAHVIVHRALADRESIGNLLVGEPFGNQLDDLNFPC